MARDTKNTSPLAADTFYEEFERQLAILEGKPDPLKQERDPYREYYISASEVVRKIDEVERELQRLKRISITT